MTSARLPLPSSAAQSEQFAETLIEIDVGELQLRLKSAPVCDLARPNVPFTTPPNAWDSPIAT